MRKGVVESVYGRTKAIFLRGCAGNVGPHLPGFLYRCWDEADILWTGRNLGCATVRAADPAVVREHRETRPDQNFLKCAHRDVELPGLTSPVKAELAFNRRLQYTAPADRPGFNARRRYPQGVYDPTLGVVWLDRADGRPVAVLCNFASHATVYAPEGVASGSFPGVAMQRLEANLGEGTVAMFVQGCAANVSPGKYWPGQSLEAIETAGSLIADRGYSDGVISAVFHRNCLRRLQSILPEFAQLRSASVPNDNGFRRSTMRATATRDNVESIPAFSGG